MNLEASPHDATRSEPVVCAGGAAGRGSVVAAARRMHLSAPAASRTLARIRAKPPATPFSCSSGRQLVPRRARLSCTSRSRVRSRAPPVLAPGSRWTWNCWTRASTRANDILQHPCGPPAGRDAAGHAARHAVLRAGRGRPGRRCVAQRPRGPGHEIRVQPLFSIRVVGVAARTIPVQGRSRRAAWRVGHIGVSRRGKTRGRSTTRWPAWAWTGMWRWSCPPPAARLALQG